MALILNNIVFVLCLFLLLLSTLPYYSSQVVPGNTKRGSNQDFLVISRRHRPRSSFFTGIQATIYHGIGYGVVIGYGTPQQNQTVLIDTGSDLCWIQCKPCLHCYDQNDPVFIPTSSYSSMPCDSRECHQIRSNCSRYSDSSCIYDYEYADGSGTIGNYGYESLTLLPDVTIENFIFGCSHYSTGDFEGVAGMLGLGRGRLSLISQTSEINKGVFSYCLPHSLNSTGFLKLGPVADEHCGLSFTPMRTRVTGRSFYFVDLLGISVGGRQLHIPSTVFSAGGAVLDSGSLISYLPDMAYAALRLAFRRRMREYPLTQHKGDMFLDTCYNFSGSTNVTVPTIELHFANDATITLDKTGILWEDCLAFDGSGGSFPFSVIGNVQQHSLEVVYDLANELIGFRPGAC